MVNTLYNLLFPFNIVFLLLRIMFNQSSLMDTQRVSYYVSYCIICSYIAIYCSGNYSTDSS